MSKYRLRFFFDYGSGVCFWAANEETLSRFNYPIKTDTLPLPPQLQAKLEQLISLYDTSLDWNDPGGPSPWDRNQWDSFNGEVLRIFPLIQEELRNEYIIINEHFIGYPE